MHQDQGQVCVGEVAPAGLGLGEALQNKTCHPRFLSTACSGMLCRFASIGDIITCSVKKAGKGKVTQASTRLACALGHFWVALGFL